MCTQSQGRNVGISLSVRCTIRINYVIRIHYHDRMMETTINLEGNEPATASEGTTKSKRRRTISVHEETYENLMKLGIYGDTVQDIIDRCIGAYKRLKEIEGVR